MLLANFNRKEHVRHRAVSLRQHGFLVFVQWLQCFALWTFINFKFLTMLISITTPCEASQTERTRELMQSICVCILFPVRRCVDARRQTSHIVTSEVIVNVSTRHNRTHVGQQCWHQTTLVQLFSEIGERQECVECSLQGEGPTDKPVWRAASHVTQTARRSDNNHGDEVNMYWWYRYALPVHSYQRRIIGRIARDAVCNLEQVSTTYILIELTVMLTTKSQAVARIANRTASLAKQDLQLFARYCDLSELGSRVWPFRVTWRHRSHDHLIPVGHFLLVVPWNQASISNGFNVECYAIRLTWQKV